MGQGTDRLFFCKCFLSRIFKLEKKQSPPQPSLCLVGWLVGYRREV